MSEFWDIIEPALDLAEVRRITEIGAEHGGMSSRLAQYALAHGGHLTSIDPAPSAAFLEWLQTQQCVTHVAQPSLDVIDQLPAADAWVIDGDHNWYTVYHELHAIWRRQQAAGQPMLALLHDVAWPCARRDQYYAPDRIPADFLLPHSFDRGIDLTGMVGPNRGFRGCGSFAYAIEEGGVRNGVLTAVEDFVAEVGVDRFYWARIPAVFGLGVLFERSAVYANELVTHLAPLHESPLIARLEENRLANYLAVIDWQDRTASA
ncbi:MAG TPA: class I SAM-dependent methyltransferase [Burkholderiaceae bacterium]|nr:class I SAM-dependent methyltransferase [Burkholderiaceae bacterium]